MLLEENKLLAPFTTFGIGGPARWFVEARTKRKLPKRRRGRAIARVPFFVLGGGSNLLVSDAGFRWPGVADRLARIVPDRRIGARDSTRCGRRGLGHLRCSAPCRITARASSAWPESRARWAGRRCRMSVHTAGSCLNHRSSARVRSARACVRRVHGRGMRILVSPQPLQYSGPRALHRDARGLPARFERCPDAALCEICNGHSLRAPRRACAEVAAAVRRIRQSKGMLLVEGDPDCRSAGSFFKNPVVTEEQLRHIASATGKEPPRFPAGPGPENARRAKVPAAWLIEQAGFARGYSLGAAGYLIAAHAGARQPRRRHGRGDSGSRKPDQVQQSNPGS